MKRFLQPFYVLIALILWHVPVVAQHETSGGLPVPRWVPNNGYWVAENNPAHPKDYTICFYTNDHVLIYKEKIEGVKLNLNSRRVKMRLKKVLERTLLAWHQQRLVKENEGLVISLLQRK